jgi:hypothetical protein
MKRGAGRYDRCRRGKLHSDRRSSATTDRRGLANARDHVMRPHHRRMCACSVIDPGQRSCRRRRDGGDGDERDDRRTNRRNRLTLFGPAPLAATEVET